VSKPTVYYIIYPQNEFTLLAGEFIENCYIARAILVHIELDGIDQVREAMEEFPQFQIKQLQCTCD